MCRYTRQRMSEASSSGRTRPVVAGLTDVGRQRKHNEDNVLVDADLRLFVVADGMGGHNAGDVASKLAAESLGRFFTATAGVDIEIELPEEYGEIAPAAKRLVAGIRKANHDVFVVSSGGNQHQGMGSTVVAAHLGNDGVMHVAHVGDSRCYRIRDGEIKQLTRDHSLINDALDLKPDLTPQELSRLPKNIITRALGMKEAVKVDISSDPTQLGDVYLLCSDGLTGMVSNQHILEIVGLTDDPDEACELLINEANYGGGTDNISAVVIRIDAEEAEAIDEADGDATIGEAEEAEAPLGEVEVAYFEGEAVPSDAPKRITRPTATSGEVEIPELSGRWSNPPPALPRCGRCGYELFSGNFFCVECGARIEEPF
jgi:protein phosphatase